MRDSLGQPWKLALALVVSVLCALCVQVTAQDSDDGEWHKPSTIAEHLDVAEDKAINILQAMVKDYHQSSFKVESKPVGRDHEFRIFTTERAVARSPRTAGGRRGHPWSRG